MKFEQKCQEPQYTSITKSLNICEKHFHNDMQYACSHIQAAFTHPHNCNVCIHKVAFKLSSLLECCLFQAGHSHCTQKQVSFLDFSWKIPDFPLNLPDFFWGKNPANWRKKTGCMTVHDRFQAPNIEHAIKGLATILENCALDYWEQGLKALN